MEDLKAWFEPLLWILGTITALVAFIRLCKPVWKVFSAPKDLTDKIDVLNSKLDEHFVDADAKFGKIEEALDAQTANIESLTSWNQKEDSITLSLLHDAIVQIYQEAKEKGSISEVSYYRACELYKKNGNSQYIDSIMTALTEMHGKGMVTDE